MGEHHGDLRLGDVTSAVRELVELMRKNGLAKIDVVAGEVSIKLRAGNHAEVAPTPPRAARELPSSPQDEHESVLGGHVITAPMIGTFYNAPAPGDPQFVRVGDHVDAGQTIGIIEAMKIMNEIVADRGGTVAEFLVTNAQAVEYGSPLVRITLDEAGA